MPAALLIGPFALIAAWSLVRAWRTGRIGSRGWTFQLGENPGGFWLVVVCDVGIVIFCLGVALHALGLFGDPAGPLRLALPSLS